MSFENADNTNDADTDDNDDIHLLFYKLLQSLWLWWANKKIKLFF